jgi:HCOMODA/2-hydroxy-3-carboxy-muconic semialdehyde decarboxylase
VSVRVGDRAILTPISPPLDRVEAADTLEVSLGDDRRRLPERAPLESPLHLAIYGARTDVRAVCRIHGPAIAVWSTLGIPPLLHEFGGIVEPIVWWDDPALVASEQAADLVAEMLGQAAGMMLRGNGAVTVGQDLEQALARAWALEDRCRVALAAGGNGRILTPPELELRASWFEAEERRIAAWLLGA